MTYISLNSHAARGLPVARRSAQGFLRRAVDVWRQRQALRDLSDRSLADIGITRDEALREARRPFWDID